MIVCVSCLTRAQVDEVGALVSGWELWPGGGRCATCRSAPEPLVELFVPGLAETKGSLRAVAPGVVKSDNPREHAWAQAVGWAAKIAMRGRAPVADRLLADLEFRLPPPPDRTKKNQRDPDKLARSVLDALGKRSRQKSASIVYEDDEQVDVLVARKMLVTRPADQGALIRIVSIGAPR